MEVPVIQLLKERNKTGHKQVLRTCDDCGDLKVVDLAGITLCRKKRNTEHDYCHTCSYKYRILPQPKREASPSWNGGRYLNNNGYWRVYLRSQNGIPLYEYEHKIIFQQHLGRKLLSSEKVHHIDFDKQNNNVSNLWLFSSQKAHHNCHCEMEAIGQQFLGRMIWFDTEIKTYSLSKPKKVYAPEIDTSFLDGLRLCRCLDRNKKRYVFYYLGGKGLREKLGFTKKHRPLHRLVAEKILGRSLVAGEQTHHINGDTLDNNINNIFVMSRAEHTKFHRTLQYCVAQLFKDGIVKFTRGHYHL